MKGVPGFTARHFVLNPVPAAPVGAVIVSDVVLVGKHGS